MQPFVHARLLSVIAGGLLAMAACGGEATEEPVATSSDGGSGGGSESLVPPEAGLPELPCPAGERLLADGACQPAGVPAASCGAYFEPVDGGCRAIVPAEPCASGAMAVPGETACHAPASCGAGKWGDIPVDADTQYVDCTYGGSDADGSSGRPWPRVQQGVDAAAEGAIVAVAECTYDEAVTIFGKAVRLWGVCPAKTELVNTLVSTPTLRLRNAHGTEVHSLAISGIDVGFQQNRTTDVLLEGLWLHDLGHLGIDVERNGGDVSIVVRDTLVERASLHAVFFYGAEVTLERFEVRETRPNAAGSRGRGIALISEESTGIPTVAELRRVVSAHQTWFGIDLVGSDVVIEDSLVADIAHQAGDGRQGVGILVEEDADNARPSSLTLRRVEVARSTDCGLVLRSSSVDAEAVVVRETREVPGFPDSGFGVCAAGQGELDTSLTLRDALIERNVGLGLVVLGAEATIEGALVRDTSATSSGMFGRGISVESQLEPARRSEASIVGCRVDEAAELGIGVIGSDADVRGSMVTDAPTNRRGDVSYGIAVHEEQATGVPATGHVHGALVDSVEGIGIGVVGAEAMVIASHVRNTRARSSDGLLGRGILVQAMMTTATPARATIDRCLVEGSVDAGISVGGATTDILHTVVRDTRGTEAATFGDGVMSYGIVYLQDGVVTSEIPTFTRIVSSHVDGARRAGVSSFATAISLEDCLISCTAFSLNGEPFQGLSFDFTDAGGNRCGCAESVEPCTVLSNGLIPPVPVDP